MKSGKSNLHLIVPAVFLIGIGAHGSANSRTKTEEALHKEEVEQSIVRMVNAIDKKEWKSAISAFDGEVFVDYSSLSGQPGGKVKATELVGGWEKMLRGVKTHHMLSNFEVTLKGGDADVWSHVYASHVSDAAGYLDAFGRYHHTLKMSNGEWKIVEMTLVMHGQKGNLNFLKEVGAANTKSE